MGWRAVDAAVAPDASGSYFYNSCFESVFRLGASLFSSRRHHFRYFRPYDRCESIRSTDSKSQTLYFEHLLLCPVLSRSMVNLQGSPNAQDKNQLIPWRLISHQNKCHEKPIHSLNFIIFWRKRIRHVMDWILIPLSKVAREHKLSPCSASWKLSCLRCWQFDFTLVDDFGFIKASWSWCLP